MSPSILKVTGFSGESDHYLNLNLIDRIDIKKLANTTAYRFYAHAPHSDLDIVIASQEALRIKAILENRLGE